MLKHLAQDLRKKQNIIENRLWYSLRSRRFCGFKFRRQHVIERYIVDFICLTRLVIIELDGSQHLDNQEYDKRRDLFLTRQGFQVLRFWNHQVLNDLENVLNVIYFALTSPHPALRATIEHKGRRENKKEIFLKSDK